MRKLNLLLICLALILSLIGCEKTDNVAKSKKKILNVYNVGDYINPEILKDFEAEYKIKINYEEYASNEEMLAKIQAGGTNYDLIFPSDYMIEAMRQQKLLLKINFNNIPNYKNIDSNFTKKKL